MTEYKIMTYGRREGGETYTTEYTLRTPAPYSREKCMASKEEMARYYLPCKGLCVGQCLNPECTDAAKDTIFRIFPALSLILNMPWCGEDKCKAAIAQMWKQFQQQHIPESAAYRTKTLRPCLRCGRAAEKRCTRCGSPYCDRTCQMGDWGNHKSKCRPRV